MSYSVGGVIQASDFNNIVGTATKPSTGSTINAIWGTGFGNYGYGQTPIANVTENSLVEYPVWAQLINTMNTIAYQQKSTITSYTPPSTEDDKIKYLSALTSNKNTLYANANNARQQSTTVSTITTNTTAWLDFCTFTHTITFASPDKARYFFNSGGQIAISFTHPTGTGANILWNTLAASCGTIVLSASSFNQTSIIASSIYNGITKVGGDHDAIIDTTQSYYTLSPIFTQVFKQQAFAIYTNYLQSYLSVDIKSNGTQGVNGDRGSSITIRTTWEEIPNGLLVSSGTAVNVSVRYPYSSGITTNYPVAFTNTWGTVDVVGSSYSE